jgi:hypothetical protein
LSPPQNLLLFCLTVLPYRTYCVTDSSMLRLDSGENVTAKLCLCRFLAIWQHSFPFLPAVRNTPYHSSASRFYVRLSEFWVLLNHRHLRFFLWFYSFFCLTEVRNVSLIFHMPCTNNLYLQLNCLEIFCILSVYSTVWFVLWSTKLASHLCFVLASQVWLVLVLLYIMLHVLILSLPLSGTIVISHSHTAILAGKIFTRNTLKRKTHCRPKL